MSSETQLREFGCQICAVAMGKHLSQGMEMTKTALAEGKAYEKLKGG